MSLPRKHIAEGIALTSLVVGIAWNLHTHHDSSANVWRYTPSDLLGTMAAFAFVAVLMLRIVGR